VSAPEKPRLAVISGSRSPPFPSRRLQSANSGSLTGATEVKLRLYSDVVATLSSGSGQTTPEVTNSGLSRAHRIRAPSRIRGFEKTHFDALCGITGPPFVFKTERQRSVSRHCERFGVHRPHFGAASVLRNQLFCHRLFASHGSLRATSGPPLTEPDGAHRFPRKPSPLSRHRLLRKSTTSPEVTASRATGFLGSPRVLRDSPVSRFRSGEMDTASSLNSFVRFGARGNDMVRLEATVLSNEFFDGHRPSRALDPSVST
jgi:hypothetical protein